MIVLSINMKTETTDLSSTQVEIEVFIYESSSRMVETGSPRD